MDIFTSVPRKIQKNELDSLFIAIFFNDIDSVIEFKNKYPKKYALKNEYSFEDNIKFKLTDLTVLNYNIWCKYNNIYENDIIAIENKINSLKMLDFWKNNNEEINLDKKIQYNDYFEYFLCDDPNDKESNEEVAFEKISTLIEDGYREIDLRLYNRIECFDFDGVKKLLSKGAKPNINLYGVEGDNAYSCLLYEYSYLMTCKIIPTFVNFKNHKYCQEFNIPRLFGNLLGLSAHSEMNCLLEKYI
ncbi:MAG: hypothetical protein N4A49_07485 [Marinifilaceae bacterium]|jgi:hypothetical protein|nr:hypothetical protein [Marinifilaceae bacterium]